MKYEAVQGAERRGGGLGEFSLELGGQQPRDIATKKEENKNSSQTEEEELAHKSLPREAVGGSELADCALLLVVACLSVSSSSRFTVTSTKYEPGLVWRTTIKLRGGKRAEIIERRRGHTLR